MYVLLTGYLGYMYTQISTQYAFNLVCINAHSGIPDSALIYFIEKRLNPKPFWLGNHKLHPMRFFP